MIASIMMRELEREQRIVANAAQENKVHARTFVFGIGFDVNARLLDRLAREMRGQSVYVRPNDVDEYAEAILQLLDDPERRASMGEIGRARVETQLAWQHQIPKYIGVYESLTSPGGKS